MRLPGRGTPAVDAQARGLAAGLGERAMASAVADDGVRLVATDQALHVGPDLRLPWDRVVKATWEADERALVVVGSSAPGDPARTVRLGLTDGTRLLEVVRINVTSNLVVAQRIDSAAFGGAWVTARRVPGAEEIRWSVLFDPGRDPGDPALRAWADEHVAAIRRSTGV